jgi:hypothetical protein
LAPREGRSGSLDPRTRNSPDLGDYTEYAEPWRNSLLVIGFWLVVGSVIVGLASQQSSGCETYQLHTRCWQQGAGLSPVALISFAPAVLFVWRRLFCHPGLRLGELGFEDTTPALSVFGSQRVLWRDVAIAYPSKGRLLGRTVDLSLKPSDGRRFVRVRLSGLSKTPGEIEAEVTTRLDVTHPRKERLPEVRVADRGQILPGIRVVTSDGTTLTSVSSRDLQDVLDGMEPGSFVIVDAPLTGGADHFVQASRADASTWHVEYRDGGPHRHYWADCDSISLLHEVVVSWADGSPNWRDCLAWQRLER